MVDQHGFYYDMNKCIGCDTCTVACKSEMNTDRDVHYRWVMNMEGGTYPTPKRFWFSTACNHCDEPACLKACPFATMDDPGEPTGNPDKNAIVKRGVNGDMDKADGIVYVDEEFCTGCKRCVWACPYGATQFNESTNKVEKCTLCKHLIDAGHSPACAASCITGALESDTMANIESAHPGVDDDITGLPSKGLTQPNTKVKKIP
jgi:anaerobic dimethyl sulfoxide reductase subunit B (iron-sulfur subunit)